MSLKFNNYIKGVNVIKNDIEKLILNLIIWSFGALALSYVLLLGNMVLNIVERQSLEARALVLTNEVRNLEVTYLSMSNDVDLDLSHSLGFKETKPVFATRKSLGFIQSTGSGNVKTAQNDL